MGSGVFFHGGILYSMSKSTTNRIDPIFITHVLLAMIFGALIWGISVLNDLDDSLEMTEYNTSQMREAMKVIEKSIASVPVEVSQKP